MIVGFIGLGTMGRHAALNIRRAGFDMVVYDLRPAAAEPLLAKGALRGRDPAEVLDRCDVVVTMVFGPHEIEQVVRGENGFLSTCCAQKYWIDLTTSSPKLMRELAIEFHAKGGACIDAPVTGSVDAAIRGTMLMFVGGADRDISAVQKVITAMGEIRRAGAYGNGYA
jgi:3-hydroxyisobutyrate dehydrogenase